MERYRVNKTGLNDTCHLSDTLYLVMLDDELLCECFDLTEIPLVINDMLEHGDVAPSQLKYVKIIEQKTLDIGIETRTSVKLVQPKE